MQMGGMKNISKTSKKTSSVKNTEENNIVVDVLFWIGTAGILLFVASGVLYISQSFLISGLILAGISLFIIISANKLPELKSSLMDDGVKKMAIGIYAIVALGLFLVFFHGAEIEFFKKKTFHEASASKIETVENMITQFQRKETAEYNGYEQTCITYIHYVNTHTPGAKDTIINIVSKCGMSAGVVKGFNFAEASDSAAFFKSFYKKYKKSHATVDKLIEESKLISANLKADINNFFVLNLMKTNTKLDTFIEKMITETNRVYPSFTTLSHNSEMPYPLKNPWKVLTQKASSSEIIIIFLIYLFFNAAILWQYFTATSVIGRKLKGIDNSKM